MWGSSKRRRAKLYDSDIYAAYVLMIDTLGVNAPAKHAPRSNYVRAVRRARRFEDLNLVGSTSTQVEFMTVSHYIEPVTLVNVSVPLLH